MNSDIKKLVIKIKCELEKEPSNITFAKISSVSDKVNRDFIEVAYADFLNICDGIRCGVIDLFGTNYILDSQYKAEYIDGGREQWFCIGQILCYHTLAIDSHTRDVYLFYDSYFYEGLRTESSRVNLGSFDNFLKDFVFGKMYTNKL